MITRSKSKSASKESEEGSSSSRAVVAATPTSSCSKTGQPENVQLEKAVRSQEDEFVPIQSTTKPRSERSASSSKSSARSTTSRSSIQSARTRKAILEAKIKSNEKIQVLKKKQEKERLDFEKEQLRKLRLREEQQFQQMRQREEQARIHEYELQQVQLEAELNETLAEIASEEYISPPDLRSSFKTVSNVILSNDSVNAPCVSFPNNKNLENNKACSIFPNSTNESCNFVAATTFTPTSNSNAVSTTFPKNSFEANLSGQGNERGNTSRQPQGAGFETMTTAANADVTSFDSTAKVSSLGNNVGVFEPNKYVSMPLVAAPSLEPKVFNGNPAEYRSFVDSFDALIAYNVPEPKRKLFFLLYYTKGPAHALVQGCQYMTAEQGYAKARELLEQTLVKSFKLLRPVLIH